MKNKIKYLVLLIIITFIGSKLYSYYTNNQLVMDTNIQLYSLFEPVVSNTAFRIEDDIYLLRISNASLSQGIEPYKEAHRHKAMVHFNVYKNKISSETLIGSNYVQLEVWREDLKSDFKYSGRTRDMDSITHRAMLYERFFVTYYDYVFNNTYKDLYRGGVTTGYYKFDEDAVSYDYHGNLERTGIVHYKTGMNNDGLSIAFESSFNMTEYNQYTEILISKDMIKGNYHPFWNLKAESLEEIEVVYSKEGQRIKKDLITDRDAIDEVIQYIKGINFTRSNVPNKSNYYHDISVMLDKYLFHYLHITNIDGVQSIYAGSDEFVCKDEKVVAELLRLLEKAGKN